MEERLIAKYPILYESHQYKKGDELPASNHDMVDTWIENDVAHWVKEEHNNESDNNYAENDDNNSEKQDNSSEKQDNNSKDESKEEEKSEDKNDNKKNIKQSKNKTGFGRTKK